MSVIVVPAFAGKTTLDAADVDAANEAILAALRGGIDETNLAAGSRIPTSMLVERSSIYVVTVGLQNYLSAALAVKSLRFPVLEESRVIGHRLYRHKTDALNGICTCSFAYSTKEYPDAVDFINEQWDDSQTEQPRASFTPARPRGTVPAGSWIGCELTINSTNIMLASAQLILARTHTER